MLRKLALAALLVSSCSSDSKNSVAPPFATSEVLGLAGQVQQEGGSALAGVTVRDSGGAEAVTDERGQFLLLGLGPNDTELEIDGSTAQLPGRRFASLRMAVRLSDRGLSTLERPIVLPDLDAAGAGRQTVALDGAGLSLVAIDIDGAAGSGLRGPAGTRIAGVRGANPVELALVPVRTADLPAALPAGLLCLAAVFVEPESARFDPALTLELPNTFGLDVGSAAQLLAFDRDAQDWVPAGDGGSAEVRGASSDRLTAPQAVAAGGWYAVARPAAAACLTTIEGRVVDEADGTPLEGVSVALGTSDSGVTSSDGVFRFEDVPAFDFARFLASGVCEPVDVPFRIATPIQFGGVQIDGVLTAGRIELGGTSELVPGGDVPVEVTKTGGVAGVLEGPLEPARPVSILRLSDLQFVTSTLPTAGGTFQVLDLDPGAYVASYLFDGSSEPGETLFELGPAFLTLITIRPPQVSIGAVAPKDLVYSEPDVTYTLDQAIAPNRATVFGAVDVFSIEPALPAGFSLNPFTGTLTGTPGALLPPSTFEITATNGIGTTSGTLTMQVVPIAPAGLTYSEPVAVYQVGTEIAENVPTVTGEVSFFSVEPALPLGLALDSATGGISGTPEEEAAQADYVVTAENDGGSTAATLTLTVQAKPQAAFPAARFTTGAEPGSFVRADFDGDGLADLAVADGSPEGLTVLLGLEGGGFGTGPTPPAIGGVSRAIESADLDLDGRADLVVARSGASPEGIAVLLGLGGGLFDNPQFFAGAFDPADVALADFDGDGAMDAAVLNGGSGDMTVLFGGGDGTFGPPVGFAVGEDPTGNAAVDMDLDGAIDLVACNSNDSFEDVRLFRNTGSGAFAFSEAQPVGTFPVAVAAGDLSQDGRPDLVVSNQGSSSLSRILNTGAQPVLGSPVTLALGSAPGHVAIGDIDGDGLPDLAVSNVFDVDMPLLFGLGGGSFTAPLLLNVGSGPAFAEVADLNSDGESDLVVLHQLAVFGATSTFGAVFLGDGSGLPATPPTLDLPNGADGLAAGDFDADGLPDLVTVHRGTGQGVVQLGVGGGAFESSSFQIDAGSTDVVVADLNQDGNQDVAISSDFGDLSVHAGIGDGTFALPLFVPVPGSVQNLDAADFDADGLVDLVTGDLYSGNVYVLMNQGGGTFDSALTNFTGGTVLGLAVADLNQDGTLDIAGLQPFDERIALLLGAGDGMFSLSPEELVVGANPGFVAAGDLDLDGFQDLVATSRTDNEIALLHGLGGGLFEPTEFLTAGDQPEFVAISDVDLDGVLDLAVTHTTSEDVLLYTGLGDGSFESPRAFYAGPSPGELVALDLNLDGLVDLAVATAGFTFGPLSLLFGQ